MNARSTPKHLALCLLLTAISPAAFAQGTAFTYQGQLQNNGSPASGTYNLAFTLFATNTGGLPIASPVTNSAVNVTNGLFTVTVDFGSGVWNGQTNWLQIGVATNGSGSFTELTPRQQVTPTPYALFAESAGEIPGLVVQFNTNGAPNLIGGSSGNFVGAGVSGATIGGGGTTNFGGLDKSNSVSADFGTVSGGVGNSASGNGAFVGGGGFDGVNLAGNSAMGNAAVVGGGLGNTASGVYSMVGGGASNLASFYWTTVSGGHLNLANDSYATVGGGQENIAGGAGAFVGGGGYDGANSAGNQASGNAAVVGGGVANTAGGNYATLGGGAQNNATASDSTVGGGEDNTAGGSWAAIGGGRENAASGIGAFVGGGGYDGGNLDGNVASGAAAVVGGGVGNQATNLWATVGGGAFNLAGAQGATIGGGLANVATNSVATVGGGNLNNAAGEWSTIGGGYLNTILPTNSGSTIAGGYQNQIQSAALFGSAVIGNTMDGGVQNVIQSNVAYSAIGGGYLNIMGSSYAVIPGGFSNYVGGFYSFAAGNRAQAGFQGDFVWADSQNAAFAATLPNQVSFRCQSGVVFTSGSTGTAQTVSWTPGTGSWSFSSDRNLKDRFETVDAASVLDKVARLQIAEWSYKGYAQRHIGAMAQDFHALFPLNDNDKALNEADLHGVELAAIKGLNEKVQSGERKAETEIEQLRSENADLKARLERIEQLIGENNRDPN